MENEKIEIMQIDKRFEIFSQNRREIAVRMTKSWCVVSWVYGLNVSLRIHLLSFNPQYDGVRKWVIMSGGQSPHEWNQCSFIKRDSRALLHPFHHVLDHTERSQPSITHKRALIRTRPYRHPDLRRQTSKTEKQISVVHKPPSI